MLFLLEVVVLLALEIIVNKLLESGDNGVITQARPGQDLIRARQAI
jgi:hypothetical protein